MKSTVEQDRVGVRTPVQKEADNAAICICLMGLVVTLGSAYCYARGKAAGESLKSPEDSVNLPADDSESADEPSPPAEGK